MTKNIFLFSDTVEDKFDQTSIELVEFSKQLSGDDSQDKTSNINSNINPNIKLIVTGKNIQASAEKFSKDTGIDIIILQGEKNQYRNPTILANEILEIVQNHPMDYFCFFHTTRGCQLSSTLSISLGLSCITAVEG